MDSSDQLVLHFDNRVGSFTQGALQEAKHDGVAFRRSKATQTPHLVVITPIGQQTARGWMYLGQHRQDGQVKIADCNESLQHGQYRLWRFFSRKRLVLL